MLLELGRSVRLLLGVLELGFFFLEFNRILSKSVRECLLLVEGVVLVLEVLQADTVIQSSNMFSKQVIMMANCSLLKC